EQLRRSGWNRESVSFRLSGRLGKSESPQDPVVPVTYQSGVQTARPVARKRLGHAVRDSPPAYPLSCVVEEVSWKAPFRDGICPKELSHALVATLRQAATQVGSRSLLS